tara:strand:+ start:376 stop:630 length:255 start_codon:yes stop_codon:yes gene_type:complete
MPLMIELGMSWSEIKHTPRYELEALVSALYAYKSYHSMDGYDDEDVSNMAKNKPKVRQQYIQYLETRRKYNEKVGRKKVVSLRG